MELVQEVLSIPVLYPNEGKVLQYLISKGLRIVSFALIPRKGCFREADTHLTVVVEGTLKALAPFYYLLCQPSESTISESNLPQ